MASKITTLCLLIALVFFVFFFSSQASAIRPEPTFPDVTPLKNFHGDVEAAAAEEKVDQTVEESCDGVEGNDCLMRRTLAAHIDYIYTQKSSP